MRTRRSWKNKDISFKKWLISAGFQTARLAGIKAPDGEEGRTWKVWRKKRSFRTFGSSS